MVVLSKHEKTGWSNYRVRNWRIPNFHYFSHTIIFDAKHKIQANFDFTEKIFWYCMKDFIFGLDPIFFLLEGRKLHFSEILVGW